MKQVVPGQIVAVPVGEGKIRPAKVLFCSKRYKNVILLGLSGSILPAQAATEKWDSHDFTWKRVYTGAQIIRQGCWPVIGQSPLAKTEEDASLRIVAGSVWFQDTELRPATENDRRTLPTMSVAGRALVEKWAGLGAEPAAAPNHGLTTRSGNSEISGGSPS
jgi:hypothetical protein